MRSHLPEMLESMLSSSQNMGGLFGFGFLASLPGRASACPAFF
jgi:hypothetical protein